VREVEVWRVDEVRGAVVHVEAFAGEPESAHAAGECVVHLLGGTARPWRTVSPEGVHDEHAACPAWARGYMGRA